MNVLDAAYNTVHDYPGGAEALAVRLGKRGSSLCHEVSGKVAHAKFGLLDAVKVMGFTNDLRMLHAQAAQLGAIVLPMPDMAGLDAGTHSQVARLAQEFGELMGEVAADTADGVISDNELARIEREWGELVACGHALVARLRGMNATGKARASLVT